MGIQRRVALIGSGAGPWISTHGLAEPRVKVTGMRTGGHILVLMTDEDNPQHETAQRHQIVENGVHVLRESRWMRVICQQGGRNVICDILTKKAVA